MKSIITLLLFPVLFFAPSTHASAQVHPGYLHALTDLRAARYYLTLRDVGPRGQEALESIDHAIGEIKKASIDDGKNLDNHPGVDTSLNDAGRFHKTLELLDQAHRDIAENEDNIFAQGLQQRALYHIDKAHHFVREIIESHSW